MADEQALSQAQETRVQELIDTSLVNLRNATELFETHTEVPTHTPKNIYEQVWPYVSGTDKRLYWYDLTNNTWRYAREYDHSTRNRLLNFDADDVTINNTATETTIYTYTVPGGTLGTDGIVRARLYFGRLVANTTSITITLRAQYGSAADSISDTDFDTTDMEGYLEALLVGTGATNTQKLVFSAHGWPSGFDSVGNIQTLHEQSISYFNQDSTSNQAFKFTVQWSGAANASNEMIGRLFTVEFLTA